MRYLLLIFCLMAASPLHAMKLSGVVTDPEGEALPGVSVYVEGTTYGTMTNLKGEYYLQLAPGSYSLRFEVGGHEPLVKAITVGQADLRMDVTLEYGITEIEEVLIEEGRRDPAYAIMKEVVRHKEEFLDQFESWQANIYLKAVLEADSSLMKRKRSPVADSLLAEKKEDARDSLAAHGVETDSLATDSLLAEKERRDTGKRTLPKINLIESYGTTYFAAPNKWKTVITAFRDMTDKYSSSRGVTVQVDGGAPQTASGQLNNPYLFYQDVSDVDFNFYRNLIDAPDLGPRPLVSPASSSGWMYYKFRLADKFLENGRLIYKIEVIPLNSHGPLFKGFIWVVDEVWAIKSVNLEVTPGNLWFFYEFRVIQDYAQTESGEWVLEREEFFYNVKDGKLRLYGNTYVRYSDYVINPELPKRFFGNEIRRVEDEAFDRDSIFWADVRPIALKKEEVRYIHDMDSIKAYYTSPEYLNEVDSTYNRLTIWDILLNGVGYRDRYGKRKFYINPLIAQVRPFGVGGYRHALGGYFEQGFNKGYRLRVSGEIDYGVVNRDVKGYGKLTYTYLPKRFGKAWVRYGDRYAMVNTYNSIAETFARGNYVRKIFVGFGHSMEISNGLFFDFGAEWADRRSLEGLTLSDWSNDLFGDFNLPTEFDPYKETLVDFKFRFTPQQKYYSEPYQKIIVGSDWPTFTLHYKKALPNVLGGSIDYDFLELGMRHEFQAGTYGTSRYTANLGRFVRGDNIQFTDYKFFRGSDRFFFSDPLRSFQLLGPTISTRNAFVQVHYLHNFNTSILGKVPLIRRTRAELVAGVGALLIEDGGFFHGEGFVGVQVPFRIKQQMFKVGAFWVGADSNHSQLDNTFKIGINFYDSFSNKWQY